MAPQAAAKHQFVCFDSTFNPALTTHGICQHLRIQTGQICVLQAPHPIGLSLEQWFNIMIKAFRDLSHECEMVVFGEQSQIPPLGAIRAFLDP